MSKRFSLCFMIALASAVAVSEPVPNKVEPAKLSPADRQAAILKRTGGYITKPGGESKRLVVLDLQKAVTAEVAKAFSEYLSGNLSINSRYETGQNEFMQAIDSTLAEKGNKVVLAVVEKPGYPALLIAPEALWGVVNVAALKTAGVEAATLNRRVEKELWRAFGMVLGAGQSMGDLCLLKPVFKPEDLDVLTSQTLSAEPFNTAIIRYMYLLDIQRPRPVQYRKACEEGWAPMPTNEIQKAVWDEVKGKK